MDDLSIYLEYKIGKDFENSDNVKNILQTIKKFQEWSGLKINLDKNFLAVFGIVHKKT